MSIEWRIPKIQVHADAYVKIELLEGQTVKSVNNFFEALQKGKIENRIVGDTVDQVFRISRSVIDEAKETIGLWATKKTQCQWIMIAKCGVGLGALVLAFSSNRWYLNIVGLVMTIYFWILGGREYVPYCEADHEIHVWTKPADEFLERRNHALGIGVPEIFKNECRYGLNPKKGTLTDLEVLVLWKRYFEGFADKFLKDGPKDVNALKQANPFASIFFAKDLKVLEALGWELVKAYNSKVGAAADDELYQVLQEAKDVLIDGKPIPAASVPLVVDEEDSAEYFSYDSDDFHTPENSSDESEYHDCE